MIASFKLQGRAGAYLLKCENRQIGIAEMYQAASTFDNYSSERFSALIE